MGDSLRFVARLNLFKERIIKYKLSKWAIGLAAVAAFSGQAMAVTDSFGTFLTPSAFVIGDAGLSGAFNDNYTFSIVRPMVLSAAVIEASNMPFFNLTGLSASFYATTGLNSTTLLGPALAASVNAIVGGNALASIPAFTVAAGHYDLVVTGTGGGSRGGNYGGVLIMSVPESGESGLMLSGLGLLGFIAARSRRNQGMSAS